MKFLTVVIYSKVKSLGFHTDPPHPTIVEVERNLRFCVGIVCVCERYVKKLRISRALVVPPPSDTVKVPT